MRSEPNHYHEAYEREHTPDRIVIPREFERVNARMWSKLQLRDTRDGLYRSIVMNVEGTGVPNEYNCAAITVSCAPAALNAFFASSAYHILPVIFRLALPDVPVAIFVTEVERLPRTSAADARPALPSEARRLLKTFARKLTTPNRPVSVWPVSATANEGMHQAFVSLINAKIGAGAGGGGSGGGSGGGGGGGGRGFGGRFGSGGGAVGGSAAGGGGSAAGGGSSAAGGGSGGGAAEEGAGSAAGNGTFPASPLGAAGGAGASPAGPVDVLAPFPFGIDVAADTGGPAGTGGGGAVAAGGSAASAAAGGSAPVLE
jgi:hypothetical protein